MSENPTRRPRGCAQPGYSLNVKLWKVSKTGRASRPFRLRWVVGDAVHSGTFASSGLAESRRAELWQAMKRGEAFHVQTGLPESEVRAAEESAEAAKTSVRWFEFCREYVAGRWQSSAAKSRESMADSLASTSLAMIQRGDDTPPDEDLRRALRWAVVPANRGTVVPDELKAAYDWLSTADLRVAALVDPEVLQDVHHRLRFRLDGTAAAGDTFRRRRRALNTALEYAVSSGVLGHNPLQGTAAKRAGANDRVDPRVLVNAVQARQLLTAVSYVGSWNRKRGRRLTALFATMYYAAVRPAEAVGLRLSDCYLPEPPRGGSEAPWGVLTLRETRPVSGKQWTDSGQRHDRRGLKAREADEDRPVPIPPVLVSILRQHVREHGTANDGRLFSNERGEVVGSTSYWRVWEEARLFALPPERVNSPLAGRPYDLRHACITRWLNAGVPIAEVARRVGNSPEVIHRRYLGCIDGQEQAANDKIARDLAEDSDLS